VFGPEARRRIWLVHDGDTLYVDRNGNGDLTEEGEQITVSSVGDGDSVHVFYVGDISDGNLTHRDLRITFLKLARLAGRDEGINTLLAENPTARAYAVSAEVEMPGWKGAGIGNRVPYQTPFVDLGGTLQFAGRAREAPVIHFGGPWQITLYGQQTLTRGRETDLFLGVCTLGLGSGTTAFVNYQGIVPDKAYPTVELEYAPKPGERPVREQFELKDRC
jgi:hypothetical protein